jgi:flagellar biosynthesis/type III secretory pathway chaperone
MTQRLTDLQLTRVSLVDKGANARRFAVLKRDEEGDVTDPAQAEALMARYSETPAGIAGWLRKAADLLMGKPEPEPVVKVATFAERVASQELRDALYDSWYTLDDALWSAIYAYDENGQTLPIEARKALVAQNLDEFKAYLLTQMDSGIQKRDGGPAEAATRHIDAVVAKAGKKISGARLERLQAASEALNSVLAEVAEVTEEAGADAQEDSVEKAELVAAVSEAITKANEPLVARLEALEKGMAENPATAAEEPEKAATLDDVVEVVGKLADRLEAIEKAPGQRTSVAGQDSTEQVKKSKWAGIF